MNVKIKLNAPKHYDELQKVMSVFNYICENCNYGDTKNLEHTRPYSIIMNGRGTCTAYSNLMQDVLNTLGVETTSLGGQGHSWNIVKLKGKWFHTDATYAAGEKNNIKNRISPVLMDDTERAKTLKEEIERKNIKRPKEEKYELEMEEVRIKRNEGGKPEIMDDSKKFLSLQLKGTKLLYNADITGKDAKQVELLPCPEEIKTVKVQSGENLKKIDSHSFQIEFSEPMDKAQNWNEKVYMVDDKKNTISLHFSLDKTGKKLTVRPKTLISDFTGISLYVKSGTAAENGKKITKGKCMEWERL